MPSNRSLSVADPALLSRVWDRLSPRLLASVEAGRSLHTVRADEMAVERRPGAVIRQVHAAGGATRRPGEAERLRLLDLAPGARLTLPLRPGASSLWLVLGGSAALAGHTLRRMEALQWSGTAAPELSTLCGARVLVREDLGAPVDRLPQRWSARRGAGAAWHRFRNGVSCRLMGPPGQPGPYLLHLAPGCRVPVHRHRRDEECLMLAGEMYVGDQLLLAGDFQVAKAGGVHRSIETDRGALVLVHGEPEPELLTSAEL